jgi:hypothetical protein
LVNGTSFTGVDNSSVEFADIDNDGDADLLITGDVGPNDFIGFYKNDGAGNFTEDTIFPGSCGVIEGDVGFLDFDGDADLDLIITGFTYDCDYLTFSNITGAITILYENDGTGNFTPLSNQAFWGAESSSTSFGDIDGDNDMDIIVSGWDGAGSSFTNLGINDGVGNFTLVNGGGGIVEVRNSSVTFADLDNDSDQDLIISGENNMGQNQTLVYSNDGKGIFTEVQNLNLVAPTNPVFVCVDIDGDADLDLIIVGDNSTSVYINAPGVYGCTDSLACNYDTLATWNDSSCNYNSASYDTLISSISIVWNGLILTTSGDYSVSLINSLGCDSITNLNLTITIPSGILNGTNTEKALLKITDMLGQETPYRKNTPLFYIYDDGTVEKRIVIE